MQKDYESSKPIGWKSYITFIVTKIMMVDSIFGVFVKCGDYIQKVE